MPLYEYECQSCGMRFERLQHINDDPVQICPECSGQVRRLIQPVGIIFKGSGFYVTDNRAKSSTSGKSTDTPSSKSEQSKPEPKSETSSSSSSDSKKDD
ncbi:MAG: hypothetical protein GX620_02860 [Chloroflexi bacterium]|nr:hypothetical protein [Chloroflexota bacterium]